MKSKRKASTTSRTKPKSSPKKKTASRIKVARKAVEMSDVPLTGGLISMYDEAPIQLKKINHEKTK